MFQCHRRGEASCTEKINSVSDVVIPTVLPVESGTDYELLPHQNVTFLPTFYSHHIFLNSSSVHLFLNLAQLWLQYNSTSSCLHQYAPPSIFLMQGFFWSEHLVTEEAKQ